MQPINTAAATTLKSILDRQPLSEAKVAFAWRIAAGATLAAATSITWSDDGRLCVTARSEEWRRELVRARPLVLHRLRELIGPDGIKGLTINAGPLASR